MKKFIAILLCIGLASNSMMFAFDARKIWKCRPTSKDPSCTKKDKDLSRNIILVGSSAVLALLLAGLAALKIKVTYDDLKREQTEAAKKSVPAAQVPQVTREASVRAQQAQQQATVIVQQQKSPQEKTINMLNEARADLAEINKSIAEWRTQLGAAKSADQKKMIQEEIDALEGQKQELVSQINDLENMLKS